MKERPIIFSGESVRSILSGTKTMTRRIIKLRGHQYVETNIEHDGDHWPLREDECGDWHRMPCPYGEVGDRLWVKEKHRYGMHAELWDAVEFPDGHWKKPNGLSEDVGFRFGEECGHNSARWRSPLFMPRWASRLTLEVVSRRVERVQDITEADAAAEGCTGRCPVGYIPAHTAGPCVYEFAYRWNKINGNGAWERNDWCWAITLRLLESEVA